MRNGCTSRWIPCRARNPSTKPCWNTSKNRESRLRRTDRNSAQTAFGSDRDPQSVGRKRIYPDRRYRNPGIGRARRARQTARTFGSANGGLRADQNLFFGERGRPAARGNRQRQDRNLHPADGRSAGSRAQRAVHAARNRVDRTTDPAHGKLFRKSRHGLPFAAERPTAEPPSTTNCCAATADGS